MNTPENIKFGLEICNNESLPCEECPYYDYPYCEKWLMSEALLLIKKLEDRNAYLESNGKYLQSFLKDMSKQIEQLEAEKKQLLEDLADHCGSKTLCKKYEDGTCPHEYDCTLYLSTCEDYEWRGLPEV